MHRATVRFWSLFERFPASAQKAARKNFELLKTDPAYPSLHFKKVGNLWSARIGSKIIALWRWRMRGTSSGLGSVRMTNTSDSSKTRAEAGLIEGDEVRIKSDA